ncbi:hypothetical protein OPQ81_009152 [Rhizoctonia solani]|nr:hypothetical protein OPQ81_009152 [Rhizoctonia solani]
MKGCWKCADRPLRVDESRLLCDECTLLNAGLGSTDLATFGSGQRDTSASIEMPNRSFWTEHGSEEDICNSRKNIACSATTDIPSTGTLHQTVPPDSFTGYYTLPNGNLTVDQGENRFHWGTFGWASDYVLPHVQIHPATGQDNFSLTGPVNSFGYQASSLDDDLSLFLDFPQPSEPLRAPSMSPIHQQGSNARGKFDIHGMPHPNIQPEQRSGGYSASAMSYGQSSLYQALLSLEYTSDESVTNSSSTHGSGADSPIPTQSWLKTGDIVEDESNDDDPDGIEIAVCGILPLDPRVESNSLPFVLQSYANWMKKVMFDPTRTTQHAKNWIIRRYATSTSSDFLMTLVANILRAAVNVNAADYRPMVSMLTTEIRQNLSQSKGLITTTRDRDGVPFIPALHLTLELNIFYLTGPLLDALQLLSDIASILKRVYNSPYIHLASLLAHPDPNVRGYPAMDILYSMLTGLPTKLKYNATSRLKPGPEKIESLATRLIGQPYELTLVLARISSLHEDFGVDVDPCIIEEIESDIRDFTPDPGISADPSLTVIRLVVLEAWRQVGYINLYMRLCGETALGPRVQAAQRKLIDLVANSKSTYKANLHLSTCLGIAGLAATRAEERNLVLTRLQKLPHSRSDSFLSRGIQMLQDIWMRTDFEGRPAQWSDLRAATRRVVGIYFGGEEEEYIQAREDDNRFDDLVIGLMDEEEERRVIMENANSKEEQEALTA